LKCIYAVIPMGTSKVNSSQDKYSSYDILVGLSLPALEDKVENNGLPLTLRDLNIATAYVL